MDLFIGIFTGFVWLMSVFGAFFAGMIAAFVLFYVVQKFIGSEINRRNANKAVVARKENKERLYEALQVVAGRMAQGEDVKKVLTEVATQYPDVAMNLMKQGPQLLKGVQALLPTE